jgi:quinol monooxygenase YgiN
MPCEARDVEGRFPLFEVYTDAAAFDTHLRTEHVQNFIASLSSVSTASPADLAQLDEIPVT